MTTKVSSQMGWLESDDRGREVICVATGVFVLRGAGWWLLGSEDRSEQESQDCAAHSDWRPLGISVSSVEVERPEIVAFEREHAAFNNLLPVLTARYGGRFVAIHKGSVVDSDISRGELVRRFFARFGDVPVYIGYVGKPAVAYQVTPFRI